ncbi:MAG: alpha/beta fold hydrolase [Frankiaceae bacterium]
MNVYQHLPYNDPADKKPENDGRLSDFLRALAITADPKLILANAVNLWLGGPSAALDWEGDKVSCPAQAAQADREAVATAVAQLAVTGRRAFEAFGTWNSPPAPGAPPSDADLVDVYKDQDHFPGAAFPPADIQDAATHVLDAAYTALWAIRSNDPAWRSQRASLKWIAVSGFDDTPHRPVNVPTAPYPQHDLPVTLRGNTGDLTITTRYMVATAGGWIGPSDPAVTSFTNPGPDVLGAPAPKPPAGPVPRALPPDAPAIPAEKIILYIPGGGSRAEEAVEMANWFIIEGQRAGEKYTVISLDLPNSAYGSTVELTDVTGPYDYTDLKVLYFVVRYVIAFIETLGIGDRVVAVMGGSLGGNTSLLLADFYDPHLRPYLRTIVSWSVTATAPARYAGLVPAATVAVALNHMQTDAVKVELPGDHATEAAYIETMYNQLLPQVLLPLQPLLPLPPQPVMWFRGGYAPGDGSDWQPCKDISVARSRYDRYEIYTPAIRRWTTALDLEQITLSFQDTPPYSSRGMPPEPAPPDARLMLVAGDNDNYFPNAIYNSTIDVARAIRDRAHGKAEFWLDTGHSIHSERPHLLVREILYFLANPDAGDSPNGTVVSTPPKADYSLADR